MGPTFALLLFTCGVLPKYTQGDSFSQADWTPASAWEANPQNMESSLLSDIERSVGLAHRQAMENRINHNTENMRILFRSLPKNQYGKLDHPSVKYMLHRYLVEQHGWFIDGLFTEGESLNTSSPTKALMNRVPLYVQGMFEKRLSGRGFGLHEIAVLASVIENSIHQEAQAELNQTYKVLGIPRDSRLTNVSAYRFVELYMTGFVMKINMSEVKRKDLEATWRKMIHYYPTWSRAKAFLNEVRSKHSKGKLDLAYVDIANIIEEIVDTFGTFHGKQCQRLKTQLMSIEKKDSSGCIPLSDFYNASIHQHSDWLFIESPEYLHHIGALDATDSGNPLVLTANYINSPNSCLQPSGYYMVCCRNECNDILAKVEEQLQAPTATPKEILGSLPLSSTSHSLRASAMPGQSKAMLRRLHEIADVHNGQIPIHGRLFAQWLHHAFPHECPYPHLSGTTNPEWIEEYEVETGKVSTLTREEMEKIIRANATLTQPAHSIEKGNSTHEIRKPHRINDGMGSCAPWQADEELFAPIPKKVLSLAELEHDPHVWRISALCASLALISAMFLNILRMYRSCSSLNPQGKLVLV